MAGPQFIHLETYARETSKQTKKGKTNIRGVVGEALREAGYHSHIDKPDKPTCIYGSLDDLKSLEDEIYSKASSEKDSLNRKIRSDANLLIAGVASFSKPLKSMNIDEEQAYMLWKELTIEFIKNEFGENFRCAIEHTDEEYPHLHFYIVDRQQVSNTMKIHPGHKAKEGIKDKKAKEEAYREAMENWQDKYYQDVGSVCGLTRLGPRVQRLTREEWKAQKQQASAVANVISTFDEIKAELDEDKIEWANKMAELKKQQRSLSETIEKMVSEKAERIHQKFKQVIDMLEDKMKELETIKNKVLKKYPEKEEEIIKLAQESLYRPKATEMLEQTKAVAEKINSSNQRERAIQKLQPRGIK